MNRRSFFPFSLWLLPFSLLITTSSCTKTTAWAGEGTDHAPCFPDETCDPGLTCIGGVCQSTAQPPPDGRVIPDRSLRADSHAPPKDLRPLDLPSSCPTIAAPTLKPAPKTTFYDRALIQGRAPGMLRAEARLGGKLFAAPVVNKFFCIQVALPDVKPSVTFAVVTIDAQGCRSDPAKATFQRVAPPKSQNVLRGLIADTTQTKDPVARLTDGKFNVPTTFSFRQYSSGCTNNATIAFSLKKAEILDKVTVHYPGNVGKYFATLWALFGADSVAKPSLSSWTKLAENSKSTSGTLTIRFPARELRHLALHLCQDNAFGIHETFKITEIEAWTVATLPPFPGCP